MISKFFILTSCALFLCSQAPMAASFESNDDLKQWLPGNLHPHAYTIGQRVRAEQSQSANPSGEVDFGFSIRGINPLQHDVLKEISSKYTISGNVVKVGDFAAGLGAMTWKMILAGAHVTAVELQTETADKMRYNVAAQLKDIPYGGKLAERYRPLRGNAVTFSPNEPYDISWAGYFLHFLTPTELDQYVQNVYNITKEGGLTYATVNAPCGNAKIVQFYREREEAAHPSPGYMMVNKEMQHSYSYVTKAQKKLGIKIVGALDLLPNETLRPGEQREGAYPTILEKQELRLVERISQTDYILGRDVHSAFHYMGASFLRNVFERVGFTIEELYYMTARGNVAPENMTDEILSEGVVLLGIKARKPQSSLTH